MGFWLFGVFCYVLLADCSSLVVWIDSCTGSTNKVDNQITNKTYQPAKQKFGLLVVWLFAVRKNDNNTELDKCFQFKF